MTDVAEPVAVNPDETHQAWSEANLKPLWEQAQGFDLCGASIHRARGRWPEPADRVTQAIRFGHERNPEAAS